MYAASTDKAAVASVLLGPDPDLHGGQVKKMNVINRNSPYLGQISPQIEQIRDFLRSDFSTFLECNLKKSQICSIGGLSDPIWGQL